MSQLDPLSGLQLTDFDTFFDALANDLGNNSQQSIASSCPPSDISSPFDFHLTGSNASHSSSPEVYTLSIPFASYTNSTESSQSESYLSFPSSSSSSSQRDRAYPRTGNLTAPTSSMPLPSPCFYATGPLLGRGHSSSLAIPGASSLLSIPHSYAQSEPSYSPMSVSQSPISPFCQPPSEPSTSPAMFPNFSPFPSPAPFRGLPSPAESHPVHGLPMSTYSPSSDGTVLGRIPMAPGAMHPPNLTSPDSHSMPGILPGHYLSPTRQHSSQPHPAVSAQHRSRPSSEVSRSRRVRLPQTVGTPREQSSYIVDFRSRDKPGVLVRDVMKDTAALDGSEERVFENTGVRQIHLVISWPGYRPAGTYIKVQDKDGFITRGRLAKLICIHISRFASRAAKVHIERGYEKWAVGSRGIRLERMWLTSLISVSKNWLAELEVMA